MAILSEKRQPEVKVQSEARKVLKLQRIFSPGCLISCTSSLTHFNSMTWYHTPPPSTTTSTRGSSRSNNNSDEKQQNPNAEKAKVAIRSRAESEISIKACTRVSSSTKPGVTLTITITKPIRKAYDFRQVLPSCDLSFLRRFPPVPAKSTPLTALSHSPPQNITQHFLFFFSLPAAIPQQATNNVSIECL